MDEEVGDKEDGDERLMNEEDRNESVGTVRDESVEVPINIKVHYNTQMNIHCTCH